MEDIGDPMDLVAQRPAPKQSRLTREDRNMGKLFEKLDARVTPGIMSAQFRKLFNQCELCGIITTRRAFVLHICSEIIDLTEEASGSE